MLIAIQLSSQNLWGGSVCFVNEVVGE